jgi:hypothetical protein
MPSNLNALIRYKTINSCLYGGVRRWSIAELIDACSGALMESRGRYTRISERTIRDDIRIMRSEILGFNAPIKQKEGLYYYSDPKYSIMSAGITDSVLAERVIRLLLEIRNQVRHPELEIILEKLREISPASFVNDEKMIFRQDAILPKSDLQQKIAGKSVVRKMEEKWDISDRDSIFTENAEPMFSYIPPQPSSLTWGELLTFVAGIRNSKP